MSASLTSPITGAATITNKPDRAGAPPTPSWRDGLVFTGALVVIALVGVLDQVTGTELRIYPLYVVPITVVAWRVGLRSGCFAAAGAVVAWGVSNQLAGLTSSPWVWVFNATAHLTAFATVVVLVAYLQRSQVAQRRLARVDGLTGLLNARAFYEMAAVEIERQKRYRHPMTSAYLDLDNFKEVNDRFGHKIGDSALLATALSLQAATRATDILARLGGDEFALLLPETDLEGARQILQRAQSAVVKVMSDRGWPVSCSIGAVTYHEPPESVDALVSAADHLMYRVKESGKSAVRIELFAADGAVTGEGSSR